MAIQQQLDQTFERIAGTADRIHTSMEKVVSTAAAAAGGHSRSGVADEIAARGAERITTGSLALTAASGRPVVDEIVSKVTEGLTTGVLASAVTATQGGGGSVASTLLKSAFGLAPLIGGLFGLFGGDEPAAPEPLLRYAAPAALDVETAATSSGLAPMDYDQFGRPRAQSIPGARSANYSADSYSQPQITINVQALDARSLLDRSADIAAAVRHAMLNLNSINDVVTDL